jgi:hypothetical protein
MIGVGASHMPRQHPTSCWVDDDGDIWPAPGLAPVSRLLVAILIASSHTATELRTLSETCLNDEDQSGSLQDTMQAEVWWTVRDELLLQ